MEIKSLTASCKWYINRLLTMSFLEIGYRINQEIKKNFEQRFCREIKPASILPYDKNSSWYFSLKNNEAAASFVKTNATWDENRAIELLEHKFSFFSFKKRFFGESIDWHRDYKNNKQAPLTYSKKIDYRKFTETGDIKYIWEQNRHQHLISLAKAFYLTEKQQYKNEAIEQIDQWIDANPFMKGVNWASSLELGIRLISWAWAWTLLGDLDKDFKRKWLECIYKHCVFINSNYSRYSSANNHLIGEAAGLFVATIVWPYWHESELWQIKSYEVLVDEIQKQVFPDGAGREQAVSYQQFVLDFFLLSGLLGEKNGIKFPELFWKRIEQMLDFLSALMDLSGNLPSIGDADDGYAIILSEKEGFNPYKSLLATGAVLFNRGDFKTKAGYFDEKSFWFLGIDGWEKFNALEKKKPVPVRDFQSAGYYILSTDEGTEDEVKLVFDCGPLGYLSIAAHGHADALSFSLSIGGKQFFIDPGTYAYHTGQQWRDYFKGTSAHNTIRIDKEDQSVSGGNFMWLKKARAKLIKHEVTDEHETVIGEHAGYKRFSDPVVHQREIVLDKKNRTLKIIDRIRAKERCGIEQFFHFSRQCTVSNPGGNNWEIRNGNKNISLILDKKTDTKIMRGSVNPILGWQSERFDVKTPSNTMLNTVECEGGCELETIIRI